jgi:outer membrane protein TolC
VFVLACLPSFGDALSFDDAVKLLRGRNESLMAADDDIDQREAEQSAARGLPLPKAELDLKYTVLDEAVRIGMGLTPLVVQKTDKDTPDHSLFKIQMQKPAFAKGEIKVTQALYAGGKIRAAGKAAEDRTADAVAQKDVTEHALVTELAQRYFGLCLAQRNQQVQGLKLDTMKQQDYRAKRLMEEGIIARVEFLNAEVALANAQTELEGAHRDCAIVLEGLTNIIAYAGPVEPSTPLFILRDVEAREVFQEFVTSEHPILKMLAAKRDLAHQGTRVEEAAEKPLVYLFGMHELVPWDLSMQDPRWAAGVGVQYTLFDGWQSRGKIASAKAVEQKVEHLSQKARRDLKSLVVKRYEEMLKAREQFDSFDTTLELTGENLRVRTRAFEEGMATSLEVVDATLSHARAQLGRFKAAFDFDYALFQLLEASGRTEVYGQYLAKSTPVFERAAAPRKVEAPRAPSPTFETVEETRRESK